MQVQPSPTATRVPDQTLAAVNVSGQHGQHTRLVFCDFTGVSTVNVPHSVETLAAQVRVNYDKQQGDIAKVKGTLSSIRQDIAEHMADQHSTNQEVIAALADLKRTVAAARLGETPGPMNQEGGVEALRDSAARNKASRSMASSGSWKPRRKSFGLRLPFGMMTSWRSICS